MNRTELMKQLSVEPQALLDSLSGLCRAYVTERDAVQLKIDNLKIVMHQAGTIVARERQTIKEIDLLGDALLDNDLLSLPHRLHDVLTEFGDDDNPYRRQ